MYTIGVPVLASTQHVSSRFQKMFAPFDFNRFQLILMAFKVFPKTSVVFPLVFSSSFTLIFELFADKFLFRRFGITKLGVKVI